MSGKPVEFRPEAFAEAEAAVARYRERSVRAAEVFVSHLERAMVAISKAPFFIAKILNAKCLSVD
jgi:hypothetical protein